MTKIKRLKIRNFNLIKLKKITFQIRMKCCQIFKIFRKKFI